MNFQDNFGTNVTTDQVSGVTTTPINSIPTVDAPYYIALDATNANSHYEVVYVTSDTATNINHAATTYAHTTDEEVRLVLPSSHLNAMQKLAEGEMRNGKIVPSVASNNLTVAIKTNAGTDPSVSDPVYVMVGGTLRTITSALSVTANAGANRFNAGSTELATKETDYFSYLTWSTVDSQVALLYGRIPYATLYSDFSATATNEKYGQFDGAITHTATDVVVNIGRFAATLSAGAGYTWTVPTFTASNLIQRPIYETRWLDWVPQLSALNSMTFTSTTVVYAQYKIVNDVCFFKTQCNGTVGGTIDTTLYLTTPFTAEVSTNYQFITAGRLYTNSAYDGCIVTTKVGDGTAFGVNRRINNDWVAGASQFHLNGDYNLA